MGEVVGGDDGVADEADEDWGDEEELGDAVGCDCGKERGEGVVREEDYGGVGKEGEVEDVDETGY